MDFALNQNRFDLIDILKKVGLRREGCVPGVPIGSCLYADFSKKEILDLIRSKEFRIFVEESYEAVEDQRKANEERKAKEEEKEREMIRRSKLTGYERKQELRKFSRKDLEAYATSFGNFGVKELDLDELTSLILTCERQARK